MTSLFSVRNNRGVKEQPVARELRRRKTQFLKLKKFFEQKGGGGGGGGKKKKKNVFFFPKIANHLHQPVISMGAGSYIL